MLHCKPERKRSRGRSASQWMDDLTNRVRMKCGGSHRTVRLGGSVRVVLLQPSKKIPCLYTYSHYCLYPGTHYTVE